MVFANAFSVVSWISIEKLFLTRTLTAKTLKPCWILRINMPGGDGSEMCRALFFLTYIPV